MKILKITLGILVVLSLVELVYYFLLVNPIKSLINQDKSVVKKGITSTGDEVLMGDIVAYFRSKTIKPGISYVLLEEIDGYLSKLDIFEDQEKKYLEINISSADGEILNRLSREIENTDNLFFQQTPEGERKPVILKDIKEGMRVKQITKRTLPEANPINDGIDIQILE